MGFEKKLGPKCPVLDQYDTKIFLKQISNSILLIRLPYASKMSEKEKILDGNVNEPKSIL